MYANGPLAPPGGPSCVWSSRIAEGTVRLVEQNRDTRFEKRRTTETAQGGTRLKG